MRAVTPHLLISVVFTLKLMLELRFEGIGSLITSKVDVFILLSPQSLHLLGCFTKQDSELVQKTTATFGLNFFILSTWGRNITQSSTNTKSNHR